MKVYVLKEREDNKIPTRIGGYDTYIGFVIRAKNELDARKLASETASWCGEKDWLNPEIVSCVEVKNKGDEEVILEAYNAG